jgi:hypothetical protein
VEYWLDTSSSDVRIGTHKGGVNLLAKDGSYRNFNEVSGGFDAKTVFSILEDKLTGYIWFASNRYLKTDKNRFACRLSGISEEWQYLPAGHFSIRYFNLPPGTYVFEVKTANNDGVWGEKTTSLSFAIAPPRWFSFPAWMLYIIVLPCIIYLIRKYFASRKRVHQTNRTKRQTHTADDQPAARV